MSGAQSALKWMSEMFSRTINCSNSRMSMDQFLRLKYDWKIRSIKHFFTWYHTRMFGRLASYSRFVKVEHTLFSLPLLFSGALLAAGRLPSLRLSSLILLAGFGARTAAFALNRLIDQHLDRLNPRTAGRELPAGKMSFGEAWGIGIFGVALSIAAAAAIAPICLYLSPVPLGVFAAYPHLKRFTPWAHLGLVAAGAFGPWGAWLCCV